MSKTTISLYLLSGVAAARGIVSAVGSTCPTLNPPPAGPLSIIADLQIVWLITTAVTYLVSIAWGVLAWALRARKEWFYKIAIITSAAGILSGIIPVILLLLNGMRFTPSWFRVIINLIILILLLLPQVKHGIQEHIAQGKSGSFGSSVGSQVSSFAIVLFGFGVVLLLQPFIMPATHIIDGVNIGYEFEALQFFSGFYCLIFGVLTLLAGQIINLVHSPKGNPIRN